MDGQHVLATAVFFASITTIDVGSGDQIMFATSMDLSGRALTKTGSGMLLWNTSASGSGGQIIASAGTVGGTGTIMGNVTNSGALFAPGILLLPAGGSLATAVPEPAGWAVSFCLAMPLLLVARHRARCGEE